MTAPRAILIDVDGTLQLAGRAIPGAADAVRRLRAAGHRLRFTTNTTARSAADLAAGLRSLGIEVDAAEVQTPIESCLAYVRQRPGARCHLLVPERTKPLFAELAQDAVAPDYVVVGDCGDAFEHRALNHAFRLLDRGSALIALQKNLFWFEPDGKTLDCGAYVTMLEAASGKSAIVVGKPDPAFFAAAVAALGARAADALVVGDDVTTDVAGAAGMETVLVGTGKFRPEHLHPPYPPASHFIASVAALPELLAG